MVNLKSIIKKRWLNKTNYQNDRAKCFSEDLNYDGPFNYTDSCICWVLLNQVVGSIGKCNAFDRNFSLKSHVPRDRLISIKQAMGKGKLFPPVNLYKFNDEYYVMDGNHRVAAAKKLGRSEIMAKIVELIPSNNTCCVLDENG